MSGNRPRHIKPQIDFRELISEYYITKLAGISETDLLEKDTGVFTFSPPKENILYSFFDDGYDAICGTKTYFNYNNVIKTQDFKEGLYHGDVKEYNEDGKIICHSKYYEGILHGEQIVCFQSGNIEFIRTFDKGEIVGHETHFCPDGSIKYIKER